MGKKATRPKDGVKLQIPVSKSLANEIKKLAKGLKQSQAWMAEQLIEAALQNRTPAADRIGLWLVRAINSKFRPVQQTGSRPDEVVRLQVFVTKETSAEVDAMAAKMNVQAIKAAAWLIDAAIDEELASIKLASIPAFAKLVKMVASSERKQRKQEIEALNS